jgi:Tfp pilus assembly protein PilO
MDKLNASITIPAWALTVMAILFVAYMGFFTSQIRAQNATETKIEAIELALKTKANTEIVEAMQQDIREIRKSTDDIKIMLLNRK